MPGRALRLLSVALCAIVALSFALFAVDQAGKGSRDARVGEGDPTVVAAAAPAPAPTRPKEHGLRARVDDAAGKLRSPFTWAIPSGSGDWATRLVPTVLALLAYGFGLAYLARYTTARPT